MDTAVIGHLSDAYNLAAVAIGSTIIHSLYWAFGFLRMGISGLTAQAHGSNDANEVRALFLRGVFIALAIGLVIWIFQTPISVISLTLFDGSSESKELALRYYDIRIWSAPAVLINYCIMDWFVGMQNTRAILFLQMFMNGLNILLDLLFVLVFEWGVPGVAFATVIAEVSALFLGLGLVYREIQNHRPSGEKIGLWNTEILVKMITINLNIFIRTIAIISAFAFFTSQASSLGDITLAVHLVLLQFQQFLAFGLDGFAHAAEALVGKSIGLKKRLSLRHAVLISSKWAVCIALLYTILYALIGDHIIYLLTGIAEVRTIAEQFLIWVIISPIISVWSFMLDGIFIGATRSSEMRNGMVISLVIFVIATEVLKPFMGYGGLWIAFMFFMITRAITLLIFYPRLEADAEPN